MAYDRLTEEGLIFDPEYGYRSAVIVAQTDKGYIVQVSSGAEIEVFDDEIEID